MNHGGHIIQPVGPQNLFPQGHKVRAGDRLQDFLLRCNSRVTQKHPKHSQELYKHTMNDGGGACALGLHSEVFASEHQQRCQFPQTFQGNISRNMSSEFYSQIQIIFQILTLRISDLQSQARHYAAQGSGIRIRDQRSEINVSKKKYRHLS